MQHQCARHPLAQISYRVSYEDFVLCLFGSMLIYGIYESRLDLDLRSRTSPLAVVFLRKCRNSISADNAFHVARTWSIFRRLSASPDSSAVARTWVIQSVYSSLTLPVACNVRTQNPLFPRPWRSPVPGGKRGALSRNSSGRNE